MAHGRKKKKQHIPARGPAAAVVAAEGGGRAVQIRPDEAPRPPLLGFADRCAVIDRDQVLELCFYEQLPSVGSRILARPVIAIDDLVGTLWSSTTQLLETLRSQLGDPSSVYIVSDVGSLTTGQVPAAIQATLMHMTRHGMDALLDFYYLNARSAFLASQGKAKPQLLPLYSVQVPTALMFSLLTHLHEMIPTIRDRVPAAQRNAT